AAWHRGAISARALRLRDAGLPALRVEVQRAQRRLARCGAALRLHLRGHVPATSDRQGPQPRQCVVLHARQRMAGAQGRLRALARAGEFRCGGTAADELERVEWRALKHAERAGAAMHILITGAAGMIGRKLTERLGKDGALAGKSIDK